jgi:signal transduction histidine kinase
MADPRRAASETVRGIEESPVRSQAARGPAPSATSPEQLLGALPPELAGPLEEDLRLAAQMRSVAQVTPAVAHDLRAPINAMVFNLEILKETLSAGSPGGPERQLRYVQVLKDELARLHRLMESYIAQSSPRGDRWETLDLRDLLTELGELLVGPCRKQQVSVVTEAPASPLEIQGNRYLLRQLLLHLSVAVLSELPRGSSLRLSLEQDGPRGRLRIAGEIPEGGQAGERPEPADLCLQLWAAGRLAELAEGELREIGRSPRSYEIEWNLSTEPGSQDKE